MAPAASRRAQERRTASQQATAETGKTSLLGLTKQLLKNLEKNQLKFFNEKKNRENTTVLAIFQPYDTLL